MEQLIQLGRQLATRKMTATAHSAAGGGLSRAQPKDVKDLNAAQQRTAVLILPFMLGHFNNHRLEVVVMNK